MNKIKYLLKRIFSMNFSGLFKTASRVSKKTHRNYFIILFDIIHCGIKYMAGYVDYEVFCFYNLTKKQRATIITRGINNKFVKLLNGANDIDYIDNKITFHEKFAKYLNRDWLDLSKTSYEEFESYMKNKKMAIAKPVDLCCGQGVIKLVYNEDMDLKTIYNTLLENKQILIEDYIIQHPDISKIYPDSVNTLRIVTIYRNNKANIMFRSIRIGNNGNVVDNFNHGGLFTTIDEDGVIRKPAVDKAGNIYECHPYTGTRIVDYKIPFFAEAIEYVKTLASSVPEVGYIGWDIAITENGPTVIEANSFPGHDVYQSKIHMNSDGTGLLPFFNEVIYGKSNK